MQTFVLLALFAAGGPQATLEVDRDHLLELEGDAAATGQLWLSHDAALDTREVDGGARLIAAGPPGQYRIQWVGTYVDFDAKTFKQDFRTFVVRIRGPPVVDPVDPVDPDPVDPVDPGKPARVVIVYESSQMAIPLPVYAARESLNNRSIPMRVVDKDLETGSGSTPKMIASAIEESQVVGLPALVVLSEDNVILRSTRLPEDATGIVKFTMGTP